MANLTGKKMSEMQVVEDLNSENIIPLVQGGINKIIQFSDLLQNIAEQLVTNDPDNASTTKAASAKLLYDLKIALNSLDTEIDNRLTTLDGKVNTLENKDYRSDWNETNISSVKYIQNKPTNVGQNGKSAYEVALENGFIGTEAQWLASLKGATGPQGIPGSPGNNGVASYFHVRYSVNANGNPMQTVPSKYIGTAVTSSSVAPTSYTAYTWYDWEGAQGENGEQGIPGVNGSDGRTSYLHIKYSDDGGVTFTANNGEIPGDYLGQYVDFELMDSNIPSSYTWSKIKGLNGIDGKSTEFVFKTSIVEVVPATPPSIQVDDYVPPGWTDDPSGVSDSVPYEYVSQRDKIDGLWGVFSTPALWAKFGKNGETGASGNWTSFVFKESTLQPTAPTGTNPFPPLANAWVDAPAATGIWWMSKAQVNGVNNQVIGTWSTPVKVTGKDGVDGADGADGSAGVASRSVNLTANTLGVNYNTSGSVPSPSTILLTATALNTSGTVYYQFFVNDVSVQNTTSNTYTYTPQASYNNMPDKVEVQIREGSSSSSILARDQITIIGMKAGSDSIVAVLSNEAHTFSASTTGVVTDYSNSGTTIQVFQGTNPILYDAVGTANNSWRITPTALNITVGTLVDSGSFCTVGNASAMSNSSETASITYSIVGKTTTGVSFTLSKVQNFSKSLKGDSGSDGTYVVYQWAKNTSTSTAPSTGWVSQPPAIGSGEYLWMRFGTVIPPAASPSTWSTPVRVSGEKGPTGNTGPTGTPGPMLILRGIYSSSETYNGTSNVREAVKWNDGTQDYWYVTLPSAGQFTNIPPSNSLYWEAFTENIEMVATKLLLAEGANIGGWIFHVDGGGNQMLRSQNGTAILNGTTGDVQFVSGNIGGFNISNNYLTSTSTWNGAGGSYSDYIRLNGERGSVQNIDSNTNRVINSFGYAKFGTQGKNGLFCGINDTTLSGGYTSYTTRVDNAGVFVSDGAGGNLSTDNYVYISKNELDMQIKNSLNNFLSVRLGGQNPNASGKIILKLEGLPGVPASSLTIGEVFTDSSTTLASGTRFLKIKIS